MAQPARPKKIPRMPSFRQRTKLGILPWVGGRQPWQQSTARNYAVRRGASHSLAATHTKPAADEANRPLNQRRQTLTPRKQPTMRPSAS